MRYILKRKKILIFFILILIGFFSASSIFAAGLPWFGGRTITIVPCTCSTGSQITITGFPSIFSGTYLYLDGATTIKGKGNITPSKLILGHYSPGGTCLVTGTPCRSLPITKGTLKVIGTN